MRRGAVITQYFALLTKVIRSSSRNILKKRKISIVSTHYIYDGPGREGQRNNRREKEVYETRGGTIFSDHIREKQSCAVPLYLRSVEQWPGDGEGCAERCMKTLLSEWSFLYTVSEREQKWRGGGRDSRDWGTNGDAELHPEPESDGSAHFLGESIWIQLQRAQRILQEKRAGAAVPVQPRNQETAGNDESGNQSDESVENENGMQRKPQLLQSKNNRNI